MKNILDQREAILEREVNVELEKMKIDFKREVTKSVKRKHDVCKMSREFLTFNKEVWKKGKREEKGSVVHQYYELDFLVSAKSGALCKKITKYAGKVKVLAKLDPRNGVSFSKEGQDVLRKL